MNQEICIEKNNAQVHVMKKNQDSDRMLCMINVDAIDPNPEQPRRVFQTKGLEELAESIKKNGIIQPVVVTNSSIIGRYTLIAGERRLRASRLAGLESIPVLIKGIERGEWLKVALVENIQRADLNCIEEALAYQTLIKDYGLTQEECAAQVGKDRVTIANYIRILKLPKIVQEDLVQEKLSMGHGRALLALSLEKDILSAREIITRKNLSVRESERLCRGILSKKEHSAVEDEDKNNVEYIAEQLRVLFKTKVRLVGSESTGRIEISYFSTADLERLLHFWKT
jgi:ParB family chromosome partitioning protein